MMMPRIALLLLLRHVLAFDQPEYLSGTIFTKDKLHQTVMTFGEPRGYVHDTGSVRIPRAFFLGAAFLGRLGKRLPERTFDGCAGGRCVSRWR